MHHRVIALSFLPLLVLVAVSLGLGYFYWEPALDKVRGMLEASEWVGRMWTWLESAGVGQLKVALAPLLVIFAVTPFIVVLSLLAVAMMMTPALVALVAERRFPQLEKKNGGTFIGGLFWSLGSILLALVALIVSIPLWLVPPLILVLPPLVWGWLTYRVMSYDALALHASKEERHEIYRRHRLTLLSMGVLSGYLGAAPSLVWASGALFAAAFVVLVPLAIWIYTLVFAFSSLWFAHYLLAALEALRAETPVQASPTAMPVEILEPVQLKPTYDAGSSYLPPP